MKFNCPCCDYRTLGAKPSGTYLICPVCGWEDDAVQFDDPAYNGGANKVSLQQAKENFSKYGAVLKEKISGVRKPKEDEIPLKD